MLSIPQEPSPFEKGINAALGLYPDFFVSEMMDRRVDGMPAPGIVVHHRDSRLILLTADFVPYDLGKVCDLGEAEAALRMVVRGAEQVWSRWMAL